MGLIQEVQTLKRQTANNSEELQKKVNALTKKLERAEQLKEYQKDQYKAIENELKDIFKQEFNILIDENDKSLKYKDNINKKYFELKTIKKMDEIIKGLATTDLEGHFLEDNYIKILDKIYKRYDEDIKAKEQLNFKPLSLSEMMAQCEEGNKQIIKDLEAEGIKLSKPKKRHDTFYWFMNKLLK